MYLNITGIQDSRGLYEGSKYHNIKFHCTMSAEAGKGFGILVKIIKVKYVVLTKQFGRELTERELEAFIGKSARFFYDEYSNVIFIELQDTKQADAKTQTSTKIKISE